MIGNDLSANTEKLEAELKDISAQLETGKLRFQHVREELKRRRETKDEQPPMKVVTVESQRQADADLSSNLVLKITAMETEQARLVVDAEIFRSQRDEALERLALVCKHAWKPLSREEARDLAAEYFGVRDLNDIINNWVIDAVVAASSPPTK